MIGDGTHLDRKDCSRFSGWPSYSHTVTITDVYLAIYLVPKHTYCFTVETRQAPFSSSWKYLTARLVQLIDSRKKQQNTLTVSSLAIFLLARESSQKCLYEDGDNSSFFFFVDFDADFLFRKKRQKESVDGRVFTLIFPLKTALEAIPVWQLVGYRFLIFLHKYNQVCWRWACWVGAWIRHWARYVDRQTTITITCLKRRSPAPAKSSAVITPIPMPIVKCFTFAFKSTRTM